MISIKASPPVERFIQLSIPGRIDPDQL